MLEGLTWLVVKDKALGFLKDHWEVIAIAALLIGGGLYLDHRGYQRAIAADAARTAERQEITRAVVAAIDGDLDRKLAATAAATSTKIQTIDTEGRTVVQPIITRELVRDPGLAAPGSCLTPGLLDAVNAARGYLDDRLAGAAEPGSANPATVPGPPARH